LSDVNGTRISADARGLNAFQRDADVRGLWQIRTPFNETRTSMNIPGEKLSDWNDRTPALGGRQL
jgi:hypothetical protein